MTPLSDIYDWVRVRGIKRSKSMYPLSLHPSIRMFSVWTKYKCLYSAELFLWTPFKPHSIIHSSPVLFSQAHTAQSCFRLEVDEKADTTVVLNTKFTSSKIQGRLHMFLSVQKFRIQLRAQILLNKKKLWLHYTLITVRWSKCPWTSGAILD